MNILLIVLLILAQLIVAQILGFGAATALSVGDGWELVLIPLGYALGVWGTGAVAGRLQRLLPQPGSRRRLVGSLIGAALGAGVIPITPATGFGQLLYPLGLALLGYYLAPALRQA